ncbi:hypothetical protein [Actinoplanes sp. NPDC026670]|uniref:hypothetical protein n=1 Tax=Actinoplanes sp. NPDC026670 TaxID=3154700 RepID=UPI003410F58E
MEPFTVEAIAAVVAALLGGAAGEAGKATWTSLKGFVTARWGPESPPAAALTAAEETPRDPATVQALAGLLHDAADREPETADWLDRWMAQAGTVTNASGTAHNTISGNANIRTAIQGYQFTGDINLN